MVRNNYLVNEMFNNFPKKVDGCMYLLDIIFSNWLICKASEADRTNVQRDIQILIYSSFV